MACYSENENLVKYLVENGVDITIETKSGETALFYACQRKNKKIVKYLIDQGANINKENDSGETPLYFAFMDGTENITRYLVEQGADINKVIDKINSEEILCPFIGLGKSSTKEDIKKYLVELQKNIKKKK